MTKLRLSLLALCLVLRFSPICAQTSEPQTSFRVKYVATGSIYLEGGRDDGLSEGMRLTVKRSAEGEAVVSANTIGEVVVIAVASASAACQIESKEAEIEVGDVAYLSAQDAETVRYLTSSENSRKYAQVVTFTEDDSLEQEMRAHVPRPPLPEVNRMHGRVSFQQSSIIDRSGSGFRSHQEGVALRADMTRLGGTYWSFRGYWRGRMNSRSSARQQETLNDLLSRTYHIGLYYNNPQSPNIIGLGRLLLPWAGSLNTLDGGYFGRRLGRVTTVGVFGGSTPDPTSWDFDPDRRIFGVFSSFEKGSFDSLRYNGTAGVAQTYRHWRPERQFAFFENTIFLNRVVSVYHNLEADYRGVGRFGNELGGPTVSRSFLSFRAKPHQRVSFDFNHNYFQGVPSFDTRLLGTGLLDQFLFQGVSGGFRIELPRQSALYVNLGRSQRENDLQPSWNYMYGLTLGQLPLLDLRADFRTSQFNSSFGSGSYHTISLMRQIGESLRFELQAGQQDFQSAFTDQNRARFFNVNLDWLLGLHYVLTGGVTIYRGQVQIYDQFFFSLGYRF